MKCQRTLMKLMLMTVVVLFTTVQGQQLIAKQIMTESGLDICQDFTLTPPFLTESAPPLVMLVMGRDHKLYYEAYNDASDIDGDGELDVGYDPTIDYYGYFNSHMCYVYDNSADPQRFVPTNATSSKKCTGAGEWSGDFLNYLSMSRMDTLRKVLYGGYRRVDEVNETVLERCYIPQDAHSWGKEYTSVQKDGYDISEYTPLSLPQEGTRHLFASTTLSEQGDPLLRVLQNESHRIWEWVSIERPVAGNKLEHGKNGPEVTPEDYHVRVQVCETGDAENCKRYPNTQDNSTDDDIFKPVGFLQKYGEGDRIYFGLLTGSYDDNVSGGRVRKNIASISDEVNATTGVIEENSNGIIETINSFRIYDFDYDSNYEYGGGWYVDGPMSDVSSDFPDWGNPVAEMMYETLRYFSGEDKTSLYNSAITIDDDIGLPQPQWADPYDNFEFCAKPIMLVISDINTSFDTDELPGVDTQFGSGSGNTLGTLDVSSLASTISDHESVNGTYFIGQSDSDYDGSCSVKDIDDFSEIRGLCPEEPTKEGGYYAPAVSYYGKTTDLSTADDDQNVDTYSVAISSPLPEITIPIQDTEVTLVPFAKSVGGSVGGNSISAASDSYQPYNTIVDFYVESISETNGTFRINYEDVAQGADHDMDAIVKYHYQLFDSSGAPASNATEAESITITLDSTYAAGSIIQHIGYIISGTTADGVYLEVRDEDTAAANDPDFYLDTPNTDSALPLSKSRTFSPGTTAGANLLKDPLWYAAKWGSFEDLNGNNKPDGNEWDKDGDGDPDTYFYVNNPTELEAKLNKAFASILKRLSAGSAASVVSGSRSGEGALYQAVFWPSMYDENGNEVTWTGDVHALLVNSEGDLYEDTNDDARYSSGDERVVVFYSESLDRSMACVGGEYHNGTCTGTQKELEDVNYLWSAAEWLRQTSLDPSMNRDEYIYHLDKRFLFTWFDEDQDGVVDYDGTIGQGEVLHFSDGLATSDSSLVDKTEICNATVINWVRGEDQAGMRSRLYNDGGADTTWRLGDVIHSTPVAVGRPAENYDLLWGDKTYTAFYRKYRNRRNVIYFGGNDGILHAVNGGFYNPSDKGYYKNYNSTSGGQYSNSGNVPELGAELWGYVPYNLLPHLNCLTDPDYEHKYYIDLHPRVFDVRIWQDEYDIKDTKHPYGWGTILVCGMRFGGPHVNIDGRDFSSSYIILDITDPESPPVLLGEITYDYDANKMAEMGYSLSVPSVVPTLKTSNDAVGTDDLTADIERQQRWFLILGSGPDADSVGLTDASSTQKAKLAIIPLHTLIDSVKFSHDASSLLIPDEAPTEWSPGVFEMSVSNSYIGSDFVSVDYDFDFKGDVYYYGLVSGSTGDWGGGMWRVKVESKVNDPNWADPSKWGVHKLIDAGCPVTGAPNVGWTDGQVWVYFGTGRFLTSDDSNDNAEQYFFGIKEPKKTDGSSYNFNTVNKPNYDNPNFNDWIKASDILVNEFTEGLNCTDGSMNCLPTNDAESKVDTFTELEDYCVNEATNGWYRVLNATERVVGQPTLLGGLVNYTGYTPDQSFCSSEGRSTLYSVYYLTGTAWTENVFGEDNPGEYVVFSKDLGRGLSITPTMHLGSQEGGKVVIQTSTGEIIEVDQPNLPIDNVHSGKSGWHTHDIE